MACICGHGAFHHAGLEGYCRIEGCECDSYCQENEEFAEENEEFADGAEGGDVSKLDTLEALKQFLGMAPETGEGDIVEISYSRLQECFVDLAAEVRRLHARVAELETALAGHRALDQTYALTDAEGEITLLRHKLTVQHDAVDVCHKALMENGDVIRGLIVKQQELHARVAELEADAANWHKVMGIEPGYCLARSAHSGQWFYGPWAELRARSEGDTPEAALEAAKKEET